MISYARLLLTGYFDSELRLANGASVWCCGRLELNCWLQKLNAIPVKSGNSALFDKNGLFTPTCPLNK